MRALQNRIKPKSCRGHEACLGARIWRCWFADCSRAGLKPAVSCEALLSSTSPTSECPAVVGEESCNARACSRTKRVSGGLWGQPSCQDLVSSGRISPWQFLGLGPSKVRVQWAPVVCGCLSTAKTHGLNGGLLTLGCF